MRRVNCLVVAMTLVISAYISGCSKDGKREKSRENSLTFKGYFVQESAEAAGIGYQRAKEIFLERNPGFLFEDENLSHDGYDQKIKTLIAANEAPDLFLVKNEWLDIFIEGGTVTPIDDIVDDEWRERFNEGALKEVSRGGSLYGLPYRIDTINNLFYNREIFEKSGIEEFPSTMAEFEVAVKRLKENGYIPMASGNLGGWFADICNFRGFVDRYAGTDWSFSITYREGAQFTDTAFVEALIQFKKLIDMEMFNEDINSIDFLQFKKYYYEEKAAMFMDGSGGILPFSQEAPKEILAKTEVTVLPPVNGSERPSVPGLAGWIMVINKDLSGIKREKAVEFLRIFTSREVARTIAENSGTPAVIIDDYDTSKISDVMAKYHTMMSTTDLTTSFTVSPETLQILYDGLQALMYDQTTPWELAKTLQDFYENS